MIVTGKLRNFVGGGGKFAAWIILIAASAAFLDLSPRGIIVGTVLILVSLFVLTARDVLQIDTNDRTYRTASCFYGLYFGDWLPLPTIESISVIASNEAIAAGDRYNNSMTANKRVYAVRLHPGVGKKLIITGRYNNKEKADAAAKVLVSELKIMMA